MAFRSTLGNAALGVAYDGVRNIAAAVRREAQSLSDATAAGDYQAWRIAQYCDSLAGMRARLVALAAAPGLAAYAREQENDAGYDVVTEYVTMRDAIDAVIAWIVANFPKDGGGYLLAYQIDGQGRLVARTLTPAQTTGLRTQLAALIATIV